MQSFDLTVKITAAAPQIAMQKAKDAETIANSLDGANLKWLASLAKNKEKINALLSKPTTRAKLKGAMII